MMNFVITSIQILFPQNMTYLNYISLSDMTFTKANIATIIASVEPDKTCYHEKLSSCM